MGRILSWIAGHYKERQQRLEARLLEIRSQGYGRAIHARLSVVHFEEFKPPYKEGPEPDAVFHLLCGETFAPTARSGLQVNSQKDIQWFPEP